MKLSHRQTIILVTAVLPACIVTCSSVNKRISLISAHRLLSAYYVVGFNPNLLSACDF